MHDTELMDRVATLERELAETRAELRAVVGALGQTYETLRGFADELAARV